MDEDLDGRHRMGLRRGALPDARGGAPAPRGAPGLRDPPRDGRGDSQGARGPDGTRAIRGPRAPGPPADVLRGPLPRILRPGPRDDRHDRALMPPAGARRSRRATLDPGSTKPAAKMVREFLGRAPRFHAFGAWLNEG